MSTNVSLGVKLIADSYNRGKISEERLSKSVKKILSLKARSGLHNYKEIAPKNILEKVNTPKDSLLYSKAMESSITLVKNSKEIMPLSKNKKYLHVSFGKNENSEFFTNKTAMYVDIERFNGDDYTSIHKKTDYDAIIITYHGSSISPYASNIIPDDIVREIDNISKSNNVILNLFLNPYSLNSFKSIDNFESIIISYQNNMISQDISADLMFGV